MYRAVPQFRPIANLLRRFLVCRHRKVVYPALWYGDHSYYVCFRCGKKRLRDTVSGDPFGEWSDDLEALIASQAAAERRRSVVLALGKQADSQPAKPVSRRSA
jgi:hypothetical protein